MENETRQSELMFALQIQTKLTPNNQPSFKHIVFRHKGNFSQHFYQLEIQIDALCCCPAKVDQHEVVQESRVDLTNNLYTAHKSSNYEKHVDTH